MSTMEIATVALTAVVALAGGALGALKAVAPHTETKVDDKIVDGLEKSLPFAVRVLEWLRAR